jgi:hypothetical protein
MIIRALLATAVAWSRFVDSPLTRCAACRASDGCTLRFEDEGLRQFKVTTTCHCLAGRQDLQQVCTRAAFSWGAHSSSYLQYTPVCAGGIETTGAEESRRTAADEAASISTHARKNNYSLWTF